MELLSPGTGIAIWKLVMLPSLILFFLSWIMLLTSEKFTASDKALWMVGTLMLPIVGPLVFFITYLRRK